MGTDHPAFRQAAPEYQDAPIDILIERIADRWATCRQLDKKTALAIVREEGERMPRHSPEAAPEDASKLIGLLAYIIDAATPLAELDVVAYCYGLLGRGEESMDEIAKRHGISRQAFSKKVLHMQSKFSIHPRGGMRPVSQRRVYTEVHRTRWADIDQDAPKTKP